jgi:hypothetical protein
MSQRLGPRFIPALTQRFTLARQIAGGGLLLAGIYGVMESMAVNISGTVNAYAAVTAIAAQSVTLDDASAFAAGDKVLLIQMKGASIETADAASYGDVSDYGNAGNYEFLNVASKSGNTLQFTLPICKTYSVSQKVQAVRIPVYNDNVTVTGALTAVPWDGSKGGILALEVNGTLTLRANIDVRSVGFRGGNLNGSATQGGLTYICPFNSGKGGIKGEGISEVPQAACRGKMANGGGGGNDHNGGGGGGGNYGSGGLGGHGWLSNSPGQLSDLDKGGRGGMSLSIPYNSGVPKLFLGGGGGGGHQNNGASLPASNGSGIVILIANTLNVRNVVSIFANAPDAADLNYNDGAGGGGAGGSVLLDVDNWQRSSNLTIDVSGGDGGDVITSDQHGPGGGGGGGHINSTGALPSDITLVLNGGDPGKFISSNTSHPYHNTPHGATAGQPGAVVENLVLQVCSWPPALDLDQDEAGSDFTASYVTHSAPRPVAEMEKISVEDPDDSEMTFADIRLLNPLDGLGEGLRMLLPADTLLDYGIAISFEPDSHRVYLSGRSSILNYRKALAGIAYRNTAVPPNLSTRSIQITVNDGGATSNTASTYLELTAGSFPVEWLFFDARLDRQDGLLLWATASELNSDYFEVQRSVDGEYFEPLGQVKSAGTTTEMQEYSYTDRTLRHVEHPSVLYRLRQVDLDGNFDYSNLVEVRLTEDFERGGITLTLYPNPASDQAAVQIVAQDMRGLIVRAMNASGAVVFSAPVSAEGAQVSLPVADWPRGFYVIQVTDGRRSQSRKLQLR